MGNIKDYDEELEKESITAGTKEVEPAADPELEKAKIEVRKKHPGVKRMFYSRVPYLGYFFFRGQTLADVRASDAEAARILDSKIAEAGGRETITAMKDDDPAKDRIFRSIDDAVADASNSMTLKRCVLYPFDFAESIDTEAVESGLASLLLEKIMDVSGWTDVSIKEV